MALPVPVLYLPVIRDMAILYQEAPAAQTEHAPLLFQAQDRAHLL
jgi:hypothetical protein